MGEEVAETQRKCPHSGFSGRNLEQERLWFSGGYLSALWRVRLTGQLTVVRPNACWYSGYLSLYWMEL
jgi:hypothetical protein